MPLTVGLGASASVAISGEWHQRGRFLFQVAASRSISRDDESVRTSRAYSRRNIPDSFSNIVGISPLGIMRRLVVVATTRAASVNRFPQNSLTEARNMKDFLEQTGDYSTVTIYELEKTLGPLQQWAELEESAR